jgi:uncharacterized membrane protein HdeD (DUF308 family)
MTTERLSGRLVLGIRAVLALLFGLAGSFMVVLAAFAPGTTTVLIVQLFASYALLDGLLSILAGARAASRVLPRSFMVLEGLVSIGTGVAAFILIGGYVERRPGGLLTLIAMWALVTGALQLGWTFSGDIRRGRPLLVAAAALALVFGASLLGWRPPDLMTAVWRLALYALLLGVLRLVATLRLRGSDHAHPENLPTRRTQA